MQVKSNTGLRVMMGVKQSLQSIGKIRELLHTYSFYTSVRIFRAIGRHLEVGQPKVCCLSGAGAKWGGSSLLYSYGYEVVDDLCTCMYFQFLREN